MSAQAEPITRKKPGPRPNPEKKRIVVPARVKPENFAYLEKCIQRLNERGEKTSFGRVIDNILDAARSSGIEV